MLSGCLIYGKLGQARKQSIDIKVVLFVIENYDIAQLNATINVPTILLNLCTVRSNRVTIGTFIAHNN